MSDLVAHVFVLFRSVVASRNMYSEIRNRKSHIRHSCIARIL